MSVTRAAELLGVHPNTVRAWTEQGRLRCLRINARGDRRYRLADLDAFLALAGGTCNGNGPHRPRGTAAAPPAAAPPPHEDPRIGLQVVAATGRLVAAADGLDALLSGIAHQLRELPGYRLVLFAELRDGFIVPRAVDGASIERLPVIQPWQGLAAAAISSRTPIFAPDTSTDARYVPLLPEVTAEIVVPILVRDQVWGLLVADHEQPGALGARDVALLQTVADQLVLAIDNARLMERLAHHLQQSDALRRVTVDISSKLDLEAILQQLLDHAVALFEADRAAVFERTRQGHYESRVSRGLSHAFLAAVRDFPRPSVPALAIERRRAIGVTDYASDPRGAGVRSAVLAEGINSIAAAPLVADGQTLGMLVLYHDQRHPWSGEDLDALDALAAQASVAIHNARNYTQMVTWAAQLQSIQHLAVRLSQLTSVREIGLAIASELRELIDYHNVRVYRVVGEDVIPVAWKGDIGDYTEEVEDQLRLKVGEGITGWVARHGVAHTCPTRRPIRAARRSPAQAPWMSRCSSRRCSTRTACWA